jgi:hypothetical protein
VKTVIAFYQSGIYPKAAIAFGLGISYGDFFYVEKTGRYMAGLMFTFGCGFFIVKLCIGKELE